ncbi:MAG: PEP-CTERM system TPR-repeat protein PrsT [Gammaproteobacteria bacterium]|nr:PEP-CTERM system TPR-repeat protein PrsT [Gammaproteobacteria bacterium]
MSYMKNGFLFIVVLFILGCGSELTDKQHIEKGKIFYEKGEIKSSIIEFKNALQKNPSNAEARWLLADVYIDLGLGAHAEKELRHALKSGVSYESIIISLGRSLLLQHKYDELLSEIINSDRYPERLQSEIIALRGEVYLVQKKLDSAKQEFLRALEIDPESISAKLGIARYEMKHLNIEVATRIIDEVTEISPNSMKAWKLSGDLSLAAGKLEEAERKYSKAIEINQYSNDARVQRALTRVNLENFDGANADINILNQVASKHPLVMYVHGVLLFKQSKFSDAAGKFEQVLKTWSTHAPSNYLLGAAQYMLGNSEQSETYLNKTLNAYPGYVPVRKLLATLYLRKRDFDSAEAVISPAIKKAPEDDQIYSILGRVYTLRGDTQKGIEYLEKAVELNPAASANRLHLGLGLLKEGKSEQGISQLEVAVDLDDKADADDIALHLAHMTQKNYDKALEVANKLVSKEPESASPYKMMGRTYQAMKDEDSAIRAFKKALEINPGDPDASHYLAVNAVKSNNIKQAKKLYEQVLEHHSNELRAMLKLAELSTYQGDSEQVYTWLDRAVEKHPTALTPRILLARYYTRFGQPLQALNTVRDIYNKFPEHSGLLSAMGEAQLAIGDIKGARQTYKKLVSIDINSASAYYELAKTFIASDDNKSSRKYLEMALKNDPEHLLSHFALIRLYASESKINEAMKQLQALKERHKDNPEIIGLEAELELRQNNAGKAVGLFREALKLHENSKLVISLAQAQWVAGDKKGGLDTLKAWLDKHPEDINSWMQLSNAYQSFGQLNEAESVLLKLKELKPNSVLVLNNLAWLFRTKELDKAIGYAERALELAPESPMVMDTLGVLLIDNKQLRRATHLLRKADELNPKSKTTQYHLALALAKQGKAEEAGNLLSEVLSSGQSFPEQAEASDLLKTLKK